VSALFTAGAPNDTGADRAYFGFSSNFFKSDATSLYSFSHAACSAASRHEGTIKPVQRRPAIGGR
jgi:hypothetical protein